MEKDFKKILKELNKILEHINSDVKGIDIETFQSNKNNVLSKVREKMIQLAKILRVIKENYFEIFQGFKEWEYFLSLLDGVAKRTINSESTKIEKITYRNIPWRFIGIEMPQLIQDINNLKITY